MASHNHYTLSVELLARSESEVWDGAEGGDPPLTKNKKTNKTSKTRKTGKLGKVSKKRVKEGLF